jgi:hypothetical protein
MIRRLFGICAIMASLCVLVDLAARIRLGLGELTRVREQMAPLIARTEEGELPVIETAAACAMLHSFYTEIEKIFKIIALDLDGQLPPSDSWHRDLLNQMTQATALRPAIISLDLRNSLGELLAFRHLFRGASVAMMRWDKLAPLVAKVPVVHAETMKEITGAMRFLAQDGLR